MAAAMRIDRFSHPQLGWHFHVYVGRSMHSKFGLWWCKHCDCGVNIGRRELRWFLS
jgi:hypothetical protein